MESIFSPIMSYRRTDGKSLFNDKRIENRFTLLKTSMEQGSSSVIHQVTTGHAQRQASYRLMQNKSFKAEEIIGDYQSDCITSCENSNVLVLGDTSEFSLKQQINHLKDRDQVGVISDNKTPGFFVHASMALDADSGVGLGISDLLIWSRKKKKNPKAKSTNLPLDHKESYKWHIGIKNSEEVLSCSKSITYVFDREADHYDLFRMILQMPKDRHLITRVYQNRGVVTSDTSSSATINSLIEQTDVSHRYELNVSGKNRRNISKRKDEQRQARIARMELRYTAVSVAPPSARSREVVPLKLWLVDALESADSVPPGEAPIHWRLMTTHRVENIESALQIIKWYKTRWMIEQLFRLLKSQGFAIEQSELGYYSSIVKLTAMSFGIALKVLQLLLARDQPTQPIKGIFTTSQQACLKALNHKYQGTTKLQHNPYNPDSLAWASWVIARLGGWKGYKSQGPPGPITFKKGVDKFYIYHDAWGMFSSDLDVCN